MPAGTVLNLYLKESFGTILEIVADDAVLYSETIPAATYETDYRRSVYNLYAQGEKCITLTLPEDTDIVTLTASGDGLKWSGMDVILPEEYARDYWYFYSPYDVFMGLAEDAGRTITIYEDATYATEVLWQESSADTMRGYISTYKPVGGDPIVRFENAYFAGVAWEDVAEYYTDALDIMAQYHISWWSNDFGAITTRLHSIGGADYVEYAEFENFNVELLKLLQAYQNIEKTERENREVLILSI